MNFTTQEMLFAGGLFATVSILAYALSGLVFTQDPLTRRIRGTPKREQVDETNTRRSSRETVTPMMERIGHAAGRPFMPRNSQRQTTLRRKLAHAGYYSSSAMELIVGLKVICLAAGMIFGYAFGSLFGGFFTFVFLYLFGLIGFLLPGMVLWFMIRHRMFAMEAALPDALDLLVVCVESGLTLDAAIQRVGQEIQMAHPEISKEFGITTMETRVGVSRIDALRNLGQRTGCASLQSLAAMLVQTERFGTSVAQALRVHAESLRSKRRFAAEERAQKAAVWLIFPVVLFIFPTLLDVLAGPAFISFFKSSMFGH